MARGVGADHGGPHPAELVRTVIRGFSCWQAASNWRVAQVLSPTTTRSRSGSQRHSTLVIPTGVRWQAKSEA